MLVNAALSLGRMPVRARSAICIIRGIRGSVIFVVNAVGGRLTE